MKKIKGLFFAILLIICNHAVNAQTSIDHPASKWTIQNCVNHFQSDKTVPTKVGYQYWFADKNFINGRTLKMSVVAPHKATHPPHKHAEDEFFFVLEGTAKFYLNGDSVIAGPYTSFYCPSMVEHGISNAGDTDLKYLVIKDYKPETN